MRDRMAAWQAWHCHCHELVLNCSTAHGPLSTYPKPQTLKALLPEAETMLLPLFLLPVLGSFSSLLLRRLQQEVPKRIRHGTPATHLLHRSGDGRVAHEGLVPPGQLRLRRQLAVHQQVRHLHQPDTLVLAAMQREALTFADEQAECLQWSAHYADTMQCKTRQVAL